jgi:hypothetical protein
MTRQAHKVCLRRDHKAYGKRAAKPSRFPMMQLALDFQVMARLFQRH